MDINNKKIVKKKKSRFFETYISKVLKAVSPKNGITSNAKQQLNSILYQIAMIIANTVTNLTIYSKKKTISEKEVLNTIRIIFSGELSDKAVEEGEKSINRYMNTKIVSSDTKGSSRQDKAGIIFPPSVTEKFLRNFGYQKIMISDKAPICFAAALEYITAEILSLAITHTDANRVRITIRHLELAIRNDVEFNDFFTNNNIIFLGGGRLPFIHSSLLTKKPRKKRTKDNVQQTGKKHRFRPGTVALREIRKYQKMSNCLTLAKFPFEKLVRNIVNSHYGYLYTVPSSEDVCTHFPSATVHNSIKDTKTYLISVKDRNAFREMFVNAKETTLKISKDVFIILQYFIEQDIVELLHFANDAAIHAGRVKLIPNDINLVNYIKGNGSNPHCKPHIKENIVEEEEVEEEEVEEEEVEEEEVEEEEVEEEEVEEE